MPLFQLFHFGQALRVNSTALRFRLGPWEFRHIRKGHGYQTRRRVFVDSPLMDKTPQKARDVMWKMAAGNFHQLRDIIYYIWDIFTFTILYHLEFFRFCPSTIFIFSYAFSSIFVWFNLVRIGQQKHTSTSNTSRFLCVA